MFLLISVIDGVEKTLWGDGTGNTFTIKTLSFLWSHTDDDESLGAVWVTGGGETQYGASVHFCPKERCYDCSHVRRHCYTSHWSGVCVCVCISGCAEIFQAERNHLQNKKS